jgi:alpha-methylacyl-CoA racemase
MSKAPAPLAGVRVLDLTRLLPGPFATLLLADLGADVVKIEDTGAGDYLRHLPPLTSSKGPGSDDEMGGMYVALNRGKRSIAIDLKTPAGLSILKRMCARADVLVEGFRPGVMARLGLAPEELCKEFPRLIVCSLSGYGQTGPWSGKAGHDIGYLALSGALSRCGDDPTTAPQLPGVQLADVMGGAQSAALAILAALLERNQSGRGRTLDVAMSEGAMTFLLPHLGTLAAGQAPQARGEDVLSGSHPCYRVYACAEGGAMALGALEPKFWERFCAAVEQPEWISRQFDRGHMPAVAALFLTRTRDAWAALLEPHDCCAEPVLEPRELAAHPQHAARDLFVKSGNQRLMRTLPALVATAELPTRPAPRQGEQQAEVLREYGIEN